MSIHPPRISVCICTFKRPALLARLLEALSRQQTDGRFSFDIVVSDDDEAHSARPVVDAFAVRESTAVTYCSDPQQNIALARNNALRHANGEFIAFIDDDEFPEPEWLAHMLETCERYKVAGVLGPVRPHFDAPPPEWLVKGRFCERAEHPTGTVLRGDECRTGNLLFRRSLVSGDGEPFRRQFGTGGEDKDFFMRMTRQGHEFRWCNEAPVYEVVTPDRWTRSYYLRRALLRGRNNLRIPGQRLRLLGISLLAVPVYSVVMPVALVFGQHHFMKYCVRFCDHAGRLLGAVGLNPVTSR